MANKEFLAKLPIYEKMKEPMLKCAGLITQAVESKTPIIIRHHADCDGYSGAVVLERAILPMIYEKHTRERDTYFFCSRSPSKAPYYEYSDAIKDIRLFLQSQQRFERNSPLIIVIDNGSTDQDIPALKLLKTYNAKIIVIDHHPHSDEVSGMVDHHINPRLVDSSAYISAGMVCSEIAYMLHDDEDDIYDEAYIAAVSAVSDKVKGNEKDAYIKLAEKTGQNEEQIKVLGECIDFQAYYTGFVESGIISDLLTLGEKQKSLLEIIIPEMRAKKDALLKSLLHYAKEAEKNNKKIFRIDMEKVSVFAEFPTQGRATGLLFSHLEKEHQGKQLLAIGYSITSVSFRTNIKGFDVNQLIKILNEKFPYANISGGGHPVAGTINFIEAAFDEVMVAVDEYILGL